MLLQCHSQCWNAWGRDWAALVPLGALVRRAAAFGGSRPYKHSQEGRLWLVQHPLCTLVLWKGFVSLSHLRDTQILDLLIWSAGVCRRIGLTSKTRSTECLVCLTLV